MNPQKKLTEFANTTGDISIKLSNVKDTYSTVAALPPEIKNRSMRFTTRTTPLHTRIMSRIRQ